MRCAPSGQAPGLPAHPVRRGRRGSGSGPAEGRRACAVRSSLEAGGAAPYHARRTDSWQLARVNDRQVP